MNRKCWCLNNVSSEIWKDSCVSAPFHLKALTHQVSRLMKHMINYNSFSNLIISFLGTLKLGKITSVPITWAKPDIHGKVMRRMQQNLFWFRCSQSFRAWYPEIIVQIQYYWNLECTAQQVLPTICSALFRWVPRTVTHTEIEFWWWSCLWVISAPFSCSSQILL